MKGILSPSSLKVKGILLVNIDESYLYGIIADIKPSDDGKIFIVGSDGNCIKSEDDPKTAQKLNMILLMIYWERVMPVRLEKSEKGLSYNLSDH